MLSCIQYQNIKTACEYSVSREDARRAVELCFEHAQLDRCNRQSPYWNPLGELINPGESVLIKPNLVKETHPRDPLGWKYVMTDAGVIEAVVEFVYRAVGPSGAVSIADAPQTDSSFDKIVERLGLRGLQEHYRSRGLTVNLVDLRREEWRNDNGVIVERRDLVGDLNGYCHFNLGPNSCFESHRGRGRYYGADYDCGEVNRRHAAGRHEYLFSRTAIDSDVVFSLPKLKTHKKAGITGGLKNLVGLNGEKNWLPHHTQGYPSNGGDEFPESDWRRELERKSVSLIKKISVTSPRVGTLIHSLTRRRALQMFGDTEVTVRSGNWWGNDTIWRTCLDLNRILLYGRRDGTLREGRPKRHYCLVDGLIAGEGRGPMNPDPVRAAVLIFGTEVPVVDALCAVIMGFDPEKIPAIREAFRVKQYPLTSLERWQAAIVSSNVLGWQCSIDSIQHTTTFNFEPHFGWKGHIERRLEEV